ncbi:hypothetical protein DSM107003_35430 [Trichormus variabilis SAG 1403-4b]|uniref:Uncharacterized protein n=1 Tax=Trichormus variabilis SAG 1403-4b TaxID=447716 RepID=A0A433ULX2_ANAVA|nr:hypothetical protein DSM107003_35430 [Trichormus variabilis SAG 1403-4b]
MVFYKQLELFDLSIYTSEHSNATDGKQEQVKEVPQCVEYEQLELDLFPEPSYLIPIKFMEFAA